MTYIKSSAARKTGRKIGRTSSGRGGERGSERGGTRTTGRRTRESSESYLSNSASRYQLPPDPNIDYKNLNLIQKYVTDRGKIVSRRMSGVSAKQQRELVIAINRARYLGLLSGGVKRK